MLTRVAHYGIVSEVFNISEVRINLAAVDSPFVSVLLRALEQRLKARIKMPDYYVMRLLDLQDLM